MAAVSAQSYYATYNGHKVGHLDAVLSELRRDHGSVVYLAGDSSLDNKFWFDDQAPALNGYERALAPPTMKQDVCYWLNQEARRRGQNGCCCINTAVEATSLNSRALCTLLSQDEFIRDNIGPDDYLVVSVGGNDIALTPVLMTVINLLVLSWCVPVACLDNCACACPPNLHFDLGCLGCGVPGCLTGTLCGWPLGVGYFVDLFKNRVGNYVSRLVSRRKPKKVIICMIYYLDEAKTGSWADCALCCMGYDCFAYRLQAAIRTMYRLGTEKIRIDGTEVVAVPLFETLDGKCTEDYLERVEPSPIGGRKMAVALMDAILAPSRQGSSDDESGISGGAAE